MLDNVKNYFKNLPEDPQKREEALLEEKLIKPILSKLGWYYHSQHTFMENGSQIKPDQTLYFAEISFPSKEEMKVVEESKAWAVDLDKKVGDQETPHFKAIYYMSLLPVKYGFLTNGRIWRFYRKSNTITWLDFDLEKIVKENDEEEFENFKNFFSSESYKNNTVEEFFEKKTEQTRMLEDDLRTVIYDKVLEILGKALDDGEDPKIVYKSSLLFLYRILFLAYAESRKLLPSYKDSPYYDYSLEKIVENISTFPRIESSFVIHEHLKTLFSIVDKGESVIGVPPYNGGLFSVTNQAFMKENQLLQNARLNDSILLEIIELLMKRDNVKVDYKLLDVKRLGSIYEGLMEYTFERANTDLYLVKSEDIELYVEDPKNFEFLQKISNGSVYLTKHNNIRKSSGSYYTPDDIVEKMVKEVIDSYMDPKFEKWRKELSEALKEGPAIYSKYQKTIASELLDIKILDNAMGSGHFLVSALRYLSQKIMVFLGEYPIQDVYDEFERIKSEIKQNAVVETDPTDEGILKRIIAKNCIYGVDINEMAVELTKLSIWIETIIPGVPLSFLSHHLKCGNSLVGSDIDFVLDLVSQKTTPMFAMTIEQTIENLKKELEKLADLKDITIDQVKHSEESFIKAENSADPIRKLLDIETASRYQGYESTSKFWNKIFSHATSDVLDDLLIHGTLNQVIDKEVISFRKNLNPFHWSLEFPEIRKRGGFDIVIGNPPWDKVMPEDDQFFTQFDPKFRGYESKKEKEGQKKLLLSDKTKNILYDEYIRRTTDYLNYLRNTYKLYGSSHLNLYKVFIEKSLELLKKHGLLEYLVPDGIYREEGADKLRKFLVEENRVKGIYAFENRREEGGKFFEIDERMKFTILEVEKDSKSDIVKSFFMARSLSKFDEPPIDYSVDLLRKMSPDHLSFLEFKNKDDIKIIEKLYGKFQRLLENRWIDFHQGDFNMTSDSNYFHEQKTNFPLYEGKMIDQYRNDLMKPRYFLDQSEVKNERRFFDDSSKKWRWEYFRVAFRAIASSTNVRSLIATVIPKNILCGHSMFVTSQENSLNELLFCIASMNSFVFDYLLRFMISSNVSKTYVERLPIPNPNSQFPNFDRIIEKSAKLICKNSEFDDIANVLNIKGVKNEKGREKLQGEIDAMIAKLFDLTTDEFEYILNVVKAGKDSDTKNKKHYDRIKMYAIEEFRKL